LASSQLLGELKSGLLGLGNSVIPLGGVELDMAVGREIRGDTTVGAIGPSTALLSALADGVGDNALVGVETLGLAVGLQVLEELPDSLDGLLGPSAGVSADILALGVSLGQVLSVADDGLVFEDAIEVPEGLLNAQVLDSENDVVRVLEVSTEILNFGLGGFSGLSGGS